jgi:hypothetical protein
MVEILDKLPISSNQAKEEIIKSQGRQKVYHNKKFKWKKVFK